MLVKKDFFCQPRGFDGKTSQQRREKRDYLHNASGCWPEKTCRFSSTGDVRAFSISPPKGIQSPSELPSVVPPLPLQLFSIGPPILCIPSIFKVHSVWYDAMHSSVKPVKIPSCPRWFTYGKFSILATAWKPALIGYFMWPSNLKSQQFGLSTKCFPAIKWF